jgi:hypothetical protein
VNVKLFSDFKKWAADGWRRVVVATKKTVVAVCVVTVVAVANIGLGVDVAYAQAAGGTIGAQLQTMAQEFSTAGGFTASTAMYVAALICFVGGAWYLWQSRQPENRESGKVAAGLAGLVLTGLFVTGGAWINKAAETTTGAAATVSSQAAVVTFQ